MFRVRSSIPSALQEKFLLIPGPATPGGRGAMPPLFCVAKRKKGNQGKKERFSKQKLLKGYPQGQNITVSAILECLEF